MRPLCVVLLVTMLCFSVSAGQVSVWEQPTTVQWKGRPLGEALMRFADVQSIGVFLDRRIDPSIPLDFSATDEVMRELLTRLAKQYGLGCCFVGNTAYFVPSKYAAVLPRLTQELRKENHSAPELRRNVSLSIPFLSEPKDILKDLAMKHKLTWSNLEVMPHDLWNKTDINDVSLGELLTLILFGFDTTFRLEEDGKTLTIIPLAERKVTVTLHALPQQRKMSPQEMVRKKIPLSQRRFTLKIEQQTLVTLLDVLCEKMELILKIDEPSLESKGVPLTTRVSFDVKNVTAQQLFQQLLKPLKLEFVLKGNVLTVR